MWPWEHLAFAYVLYSAAVRVRSRTRPRGDSVVVVAVTSILPDLIDKPLSWTFELTATGYSVAHSLFLAPLWIGGALVAARRVGRRYLGGAFALGFLSHLVADVVYPVVTGGSVAVHAVLWPVVEGRRTTSGGLTETFLRYFTRFIGELTAANPSGILLFELALAGFTFILWAADGFPVATELYDALAERAR